MNTIRTLSFAAAAALSLGLGTAMAQDGPSTQNASDWTQRPSTQYQAPARSNQTPQSGSSDVNTMQPAGRVAPGVDYGTIDSPG
jgi:hypothetical protein